MPQPLDFQSEANRVTATERIQQIADRASLASQYRARLEGEDEQVRQETQVQESQRGEHEGVDADKRGGSDQSRRDRRPAQTNTEGRIAPDPSKLPVIPSEDTPHFDVNA